MYQHVIKHYIILSFDVVLYYIFRSKMPQLVAFNRKWAIGSDDFVYPGIGEIVLRCIW